MINNKLLNRINPLFLKGICHRGLHNDIYCENSILAFKNAIDNNFAFELDVHLTKDKELVVIHDSTLKRVTLKDGVVEDLTYNELLEYNLLDNTKIPLLSDVLKLNNEKVPIVVELKAYNKNHKELAKKTLEVLSLIKDKRNILLISFDPRCLFPLKNKGYVIQLLFCKSASYTWFFRHFFDGIDIEYGLLKEKKYNRYTKKHFTNVWTINNIEIFNSVKQYIDTCTFELMDKDYIRNNL